MERIAQLSGDWVTRKEAASYLGVHPMTVKTWEKKGLLDSRPLGYRTLRISAISIERMMERATQPKTVQVAGSTRTLKPRM